MQADADGNVVYGEHIKRWVPIIFELRKNKLLSRYLEEGATETLGIVSPDLARLETLFPLLPQNTLSTSKPRASGRRSRARENRDSFYNDKPHSFNRSDSRKSTAHGDHSRSHNDSGHSGRSNSKRHTHCGA